MANKSRKGEHISRRGILPILGSTFLLPFLGFGRTYTNEVNPTNEEEYQTLLKPDGTTVKVKISAINKSKIIKKNISNTSFLNWLGKKI
jgi:hypothetical protein